MAIHQFNLHYNPEEDRILFRMNTMNREEFRFVLTRRYVRLLWPILQKLLDSDFRRREPDKAHVARDMVQFEHEQVLANADFSQQYDEQMETYPLGEDYVLLSRIQVKQGPVNILCLHPSQGLGIEFPATHVFLHAFCKLLADTVSKAGWDLEYLFGGQMQDQQIETERPKVLH